MIRPVIKWRDGACTITAGDSWLVFTDGPATGRLTLRGRDQLREFYRLGMELQQRRNHNKSGGHTIGKLEILVSSRHDFWKISDQRGSDIRFEGRTIDDVLAWSAAAIGEPLNCGDDLDKLSVFRDCLVCRGELYPVGSETELRETILAALGDVSDKESWPLPLGSGAELSLSSEQTFILALPSFGRPLTLRRSSLARLLVNYCDSPQRSAMPF